MIKVRYKIEDGRDNIAPVFYFIFAQMIYEILKS